MSRADMVVIIACAVSGYLLVKAWMKWRGDSSSDSSPYSPNRRDSEAVTLSNWYRILGVREDAKKDEIVAAWKRRISEYHPDKVARMGEEIREVAARKSQQINAAYEMGMRLFTDR